MRLSLTILSLFLAVTLIAGKPAKPTASSNRVDPAPGATPQLSLVCSYPAVLSTCQKDCDCTGLEEDSTQPDCGTTVCTHNCQCLSQPPPSYYSPPYEKDDSAAKPPKYAKSRQGELANANKINGKVTKPY